MLIITIYDNTAQYVLQIYYKPYFVSVLLNTLFERFLKDKGILFRSDSRERICLGGQSRTLYVEIVRLT